MCDNAPERHGGRSLRAAPPTCRERPLWRSGAACAKSSRGGHHFSTIRSGLGLAASGCSTVMSCSVLRVLLWITALAASLYLPGGMFEKLKLPLASVVAGGIFGPFSEETVISTPAAGSLPKNTVPKSLASGAAAAASAAAFVMIRHFCFV